MCGIVAGVSRSSNVLDFLLAGLNSLEYRGYDSAGLAVQHAGTLVRVRAVGRVAALEEKTRALTATYSCGIAHTRWATHGVAAERNAHPHQLTGGGLQVAVVHNGIIENHEVLRAELVAAGHVFTSDTDTEVVVHLMHQAMSAGLGLADALRAVRLRLKGLFALAVVDSRHPNVIAATRHGAPLVLGVAEDGLYLASDVCALLSRTRRVVHLADDDFVTITDDAYEIRDARGLRVDRAVTVSALEATALELGGHPHYMHKEIFEQPQVLERLTEFARTPATALAAFGPLAPELLSRARHVLVLACGTSYHAGLIARQWIESLARVHCTVEVASEFRYRNAVMLPDTLVVTVSQSGETADTRAALEYAIEQGAMATLAVCNVPESALTRMSDITMLTQAGAEIGVASTKAFTTQLVALYLLALNLAHRQGSMTLEQMEPRLTALARVPRMVDEALSLDDAMRRWAAQLKHRTSALFLGRNLLHPVACEGALKLKEIAYIHAEAYSAGELKHGPLALVDAQMPVIVSVDHDEMLDKVKANLQEVLARDGELFVVASTGCALQPHPKMHVVELPAPVANELAPLAHVVALQLLAYHTAVVLGTDVDKPRNLAKSVTTE